MNIAIVLAGGTGTRLDSDIPKQYIEVAGKPIICYCLETLNMHPCIDGIQIVADVSWRGYLKKLIEEYRLTSKWRGFSNPGINRQLSIFHALEDMEKYIDKEDCVIVHDAARPLLSSEILTEGIDNMAVHDGVLPILPMKDTVYYSKNGSNVSSLLKRENVFAGQAPEFFRYGKYYDANKALLPEKILSINGSTEPAILAGMDIAMIDGEEENFKITTKEDLERFRQKRERMK